ncbi:MAG: DUF6527 family protein [Bryobacteraceae bacterium]
MKQEIALKHEFVQFIPEELTEGTVYISIRFATVAHLCACGCKTKVVTPLKPTDWKLIFDGKTISLDPSIGNWSFPCRSHYWIRNNKVRWAEDWSQSRIDANRTYDRRAKEEYFGTAKGDAAEVAPAVVTTPKEESIWQKVKQWWRS